MSGDGDWWCKMYRNPGEFARGQLIKLILAALIYAVAVAYSGRWLP